MKVFFGFDSLPRFNDPVVTVGSYDGVHAGHRILLGNVKTIARGIGGESVVVTFSPHPRKVVDKSGEKLELLNSIEEKMLLLNEIGIDNLIVIPFTEEFSRVSSCDFVRDCLVGRVGVRVLVVGYNHHFGHNKEGDFGYLDRLKSEYGFEVCEQSRQDLDNGKVSSTIVRRLISHGDMSEAGRYLGRPYIMMAAIDGGMVVPQNRDKVLPPPGKYKVKVGDGGAVYEAELVVDAGRQLSLDPPREVSDDELIITFC